MLFLLLLPLIQWAACSPLMDASGNDDAGLLKRADPVAVNCDEEYSQSDVVSAYDAIQTTPPLSLDGFPKPYGGLSTNPENQRIMQAAIAAAGCKKNSRLKPKLYEFPLEHGVYSGGVQSDSRVVAVQFNTGKGKVWEYCFAMYHPGVTPISNFGDFLPCNPPGIPAPACAGPPGANKKRQWHHQDSCDRDWCEKWCGDGCDECPGWPGNWHSNPWPAWSTEAA